MGISGARWNYSKLASVLTAFSVVALAPSVGWAGKDDLSLAGYTRAQRAVLERHFQSFPERIKRRLEKDKPAGVKIYYHIDLDGVTSALAMKHFLRLQGVTNFEFEGIQYGDREYAVKKPKEGWMPVLVDFSHGKPWIAVHADHHESRNRPGVDRKSTEISFVTAPANATFLSTLDPRNPAFTRTDLATISMVDSAGYAGRYTPEQQRDPVFTLDRSKSGSTNRERLGLVVNNKLQAIKNKTITGEAHELLNNVLMNTDSPSLLRLNLELDRVVREYNESPVVKEKPQKRIADPQTMKQNRDAYALTARELVVTGNVDDIPTLKTGASMMIGKVAVINGSNSGNRKSGGYNRYVFASTHPEAEFVNRRWAVGMIQLAVNPFCGGTNPVNLGDLLLGDEGVLAKYKAELQGTRISLDRIKYINERSIKDNGIEGAVGYMWSDFSSTFNRKVSGVRRKNDPTRHQRIIDAANKPYADLTEDERTLLAEVSVNAWDLIQANSGGHHNISQISGINYLPRSFRPGGYTTFLKELQQDVAQVMRDMSLKQ